MSKLAKNEHLLVKNSITLEKINESKIPRPQIKESYETISELDDYIEQEPNTKMLGLIKFHLSVYNYTTRERRKKKSDDNQSVVEGIETKINKIVGEAPVLVNPQSVKKTAQQMHLHLYNKGYFNNVVRDSIAYKNYIKHDGGKARVFYEVKPGDRYTIGKFDYEFEDEGIKTQMPDDIESSLIKVGYNYDKELLDKERERIVKKLKNQGYFFFTKEHIRFLVDTSLDGNSIGITTQIERFKQKSELGIEEQNHRRYKIDEIYIQPDFYPDEEVRPLDTVQYADYNFLIFPGSLNEKGDRNAYIRFKTLSRKVFMRKDEYYKIDNFQNTYKHLAALKIFKFINIQFQLSETEDELICLIQLNPVPKHSIQIEAEGTNAEGYFGIAQNFIYRNKNTFKGAEMFETSINAALEAQPSLTQEQQSYDNLGLFNTIEVGPELTLNFPRLLFPIKEEMIPKRYDAKSSIHILYNYQVRSEYTRWIWNAGLTYEWKESRQKTHILSPFNVSSVKIKEGSPILQDTTLNPYLKNSFTDHLISATRYSFIYTSQELNKKVNFTYFRGNLELSGNALQGVMALTNAENETAIFGIKYAQYVKADVDVRNYYFSNKHSSVVMRFAAGLGLPYGNSNVMPFEKSYFSGGANGLRAWPALNLGPGSHRDSTNDSNNDHFEHTHNHNQIADIKLEWNLESRFEFIGPIEGAAFIDAGNIWLKEHDEYRPDGKFDFSTFYNEIALGAGLGIRLNYNYFIIRIDAAIPIKDPGEPTGKRWVPINDGFSKIVYNLGIG